MIGLLLIGASATILAEGPKSPEVPSLEVVAQHLVEVKSNYTSGVWDFNSFHFQSGQQWRYRAFRDGWRSKLELIRNDGSVGMAEAMADGIHFKVRRSAGNDPFRLDALDACKVESLVFPSGEVVPEFICEVWGSGLLPILLARAPSIASGNPIVSAKWESRGAVEVLRLYVRDTAASRLEEASSIDVRPDRSWVVDRLTHPVFSGPPSDSARRKIGNALLELDFEDRPNEFPLLKELRRSESEDGKPTVVSYKATVIGFKPGKVDLREFSPERYGISHGPKPKPPWWRWPAIIAGGAAVVGGFWWWRRRALG